jgi:hypothetical protein
MDLIPRQSDWDIEWSRSQKGQLYSLLYFPIDFKVSALDCEYWAGTPAFDALYCNLTGPGALTAAAQQCPSSAYVLGTFAAANVAAALLCIPMSHRRVTAFLSGGILGKPGSASWRYMWIVMVLLQVAASLALAFFARRAYPELQLNVGWLSMLLLSRPRVAWLALQGLNWQFGEVYESAARTAYIAESALEPFAVVTMGYVATFANTRGYLKFEYDIIRRDAHTMYAGAFLYLFFCPLWLLFNLGYSSGLIGGKQNKTVGAPVDGAPSSVDDDEKDVRGSLAYIQGFTIYLGQWLFWGGFVSIAGEL